MLSKADCFMKLEPSRPREVESHHCGMTQYSYGTFRGLDLAMTHQIIMSTRCCMVEPGLPDDKHAQWKKGRKKSAGFALQ